MTRLELDELREEARLKYDHPKKPAPMLLNPRGVLALIARGDRLEAAGLLMERLLKRASEALYCGVRGIPPGRNAWELSGEIDFYLAAREEDRRSASAPAPQPLPEEQLPKEGVAAAPTLLVKALFEVDEPEPETGPDPDHGMDAAAPAPGDADETNLQVHAAVGHVRFLLLALDGGCDTRTTMRSIRDAREWVEARQKEHAERLARARASDATSAGGGE